MPLIGYCRVSTGDQTLDLQRDALQAVGCLDIYEEYASGAKQARPELANALRACRAGDTLVIWKLDRLGRNLHHLLEIVEDLNKKQVELRILTGFQVDTTPHGRLLLQMLGAFAEYERALIRERILAGLASARARGRKGGRKPKLTPHQQAQARAMHAGGMAVSVIARDLGCDRKTIYKSLAQAQPAQAEAAD